MFDKGKTGAILGHGQRKGLPLISRKRGEGANPGTARPWHTSKGRGSINDFRSKRGGQVLPLQIEDGGFQKKT